MPLRECAILAHCHARVRHTGSVPCAHACVRHVTCKPLRARHTVAPFWLTLVRRARHLSAHAPCASARGPIRVTRLHATSPTTWSLQPLCSTTRTRSKIQRRLAAMRTAKCAIKAPHCASSPTPRAHELGYPLQVHLVSASMKY
ncbi:hypothetical protein Hanom_Chr05g00469021 [Helianthus anomalus]